jgi:hypothetical protein
VELVEIPQMETGAPLPEIKIIGAKLRCAYICSNPDFPGWDSGADSNHPGFDEYCAVIEFRDVSSYKFGAPNDEALYNHPLYKLGADYYGFYKFEKSPELKLQNDDWFWVATFHDETLQVAARSFSIVSSRVNTNSPKKALEVVK